MTKLLKKDENFRFCLLGCGRGTGTMGTVQRPWRQDRDGQGHQGMIWECETGSWQWASLPSQGWFPNPE